MPPRKLKMRMPPPARPGEVNHAFVDRFTFVHFGIGMAYELLGFTLELALLLALAWEILENPLKAYASFLFPHATADTLANSLGDMLAVCAGWLLLSSPCLARL